MNNNSPRTLPSKMASLLIASLLCSVLSAGRVGAQQVEPSPSNYRQTLQQQLEFEIGPASGVPRGWSGDSAVVFSDHQVFHGGKSSVRIERTADSANSFSAATKSIPIDFMGTSIELRGYLRTRDAVGAGIWMREDGIRRALKFDNMQNRLVAGTKDWMEYSITLPLDKHASTLYFGILLQGTGAVWADDFRLLIDGKPVSELPSIERPKSILETNHEFDDGSKVNIASLSRQQIDNLAELARVWGFLKYHHPAVTAGTKQWDFELFRVLPAIIDAPTAHAAQKVLVEWIDGLGPVAACNPCVKAVKESQSKPRLQWLADDREVGVALSERLMRILANRVPDQQFYVELAPNVGNPDFVTELPYEKLKFPDAGYQLLALFRFWNIVEYWAPNRDLIKESWDGVLKESIPGFALARTDLDYDRALVKLIAHLHDTHANLWGSSYTPPPEGECAVPATIRFVGAAAVVTSSGNSGLLVGDVITGIDDIALTRLIEQWSPYYSASNDPARLRNIGRRMLYGSCGSAHLDVKRGASKLRLSASRVSKAELEPFAAPSTHDLTGETFRLLSPDVAYLKLSTIKAADIPGYMEKAAKTKGLIVDIRNYPSQFVVFDLGSLLVENDTNFALFTHPLLSSPGAFDWTAPMTLKPRAPHYGGKVVILVDEISVSQAEYTAMALRSSPLAVVIGSTTAGADGNVSPLSLPGNLRTAISGLGVFYPDKRQTQRIGVVPDIRVEPTIGGIRAGADEVLERALHEILGDSVSSADLRNLYAAKPQ